MADSLDPDFPGSLLSVISIVQGIPIVLGSLLSLDPYCPGPTPYTLRAQIPIVLEPSFHPTCPRARIPVVPLPSWVKASSPPRTLGAYVKGKSKAK